MDIGKKLRELRKQNDLTLEDLASRSELTKGFLSQVERNLTAPSIATLEDILEALGSNLSEFFHEEEEKSRSCSEQMISSLMRKKITRWNGSFECAEEPDGADSYDTLSA